MPRKKLDRRGEKPQYRSRAKTWVARVWEVDGSCSGWTDLGTDNKELALQIYQRWLETGEKPQTERGKETFEQAAARIVDAGEAEAKKAGDEATLDLLRDRRTRLRAYAVPRIGMVEVARIQAHHVASVLDGMAKTDGKGAGTILKMRSDISQILATLRREGVVQENCARELALPKQARIDTRERVSLTDEQILVFQQKRGFKTPLDMMALFSRCVAGHRTSDAHAGLWEEVDLLEFSSMKVRRPKTDGEKGQSARVGRRRTRAYELVTHEIDEQYREPIRAYWMRQGRPTSGPIFPLLRDGVAAPMKLKDGRVIMRRASKAGGKKNRGSSYAKALRRAVWEARIFDPMPVGTLIQGVPTTEEFDPESPNMGLCRLQTDTDTTRKLDFQSFRRGLVTALADANVNVHTQLAITGHTQLTTQQKHYMNKRRVRVPKEALPGGAVQEEGPSLSPEMLAALEVLQRGLGLGGAGRPGASLSPALENSPDSIPRLGMIQHDASPQPVAKLAKRLASPVGIEPTTSALGKPGTAESDSKAPVNPESVGGGSRPPQTVFSQAVGENGTPREGLLAAAAKAVLAGDWALAERIRAVIESPKPAPVLAPVVNLDDARKGRP